MDEKKREEIALFRYHLIVPFLTQEQLEWGVKKEIVQRIVQQVQTIPYSEKTSLNESTLRRYLKIYLEKGFEGLKPSDRDDLGSCQKIPPEILEKAFMLKREEPRRSTRKIIQLMEAHEMTPPGLIRRSTLHRHLIQNGLTADELKKNPTAFRPFQADYPNQIWQSDVMNGPYLPDPDRPSAKKPTYLVAIIDDFARLVPHAEFYWHENLPCLENTLQKALLKYGIPEVYYVDNAQIFSAHQMHLIGAELGMRIIHCKRYQPEGKGKIERFLETIQRDFLTELAHEKVSQLHELNQKFWAWLELEYQQKIHSSTHEAPRNRWRQYVTGHLKKIDEQKLQTIFLWRANRKVTKTGLVSVQGIDFEVESFLAGKTIEVRYHHFDLSQVAIYQAGHLLQYAKPVKISRWNTVQKQQPKPIPPPQKSNINHLALLEQQQQQQKVAQAEVLLGQQPPPNDFTRAHFIHTVATALKRKLETWHASELEALNQAWQTYGPFEPALIHTALAKAIIEKRYDQHVSFYIQAIVATHLKHQTTFQENQR